MVDHGWSLLGDRGRANVTIFVCWAALCMQGEKKCAGYAYTEILVGLRVAAKSVELRYADYAGLLDSISVSDHSIPPAAE
jgi:hypothetical protein